MKKMKYLLVLVIMTGYMLLSVFSYDIQQKRDFTSLARKYTSSISLDSIVLSDEQFNKLVDLSKENNVLVSVTKNLSLNDEELTVVYVSFDRLSEFSHLLEGVRVSEESLLVPSFVEHKTSNYKEFLSNDRYGYGLLADYWNDSNLNMVNVHYDDEASFSNFLDEMTRYLNVTKDSISKNMSDNDQGFKRLMNFAKIAYYLFSCLLILGIGVLLAYELTRNTKQIAIKKINGYSQLQLLVEVIRPPLIFMGVYQVILVMISYFLLGKRYTRSFLTESVLLISFIIIGLFLISLSLVKEVKLSEIIKNKRKTNKVIAVNTVLRLLLLVVMTVSIVSSFSFLSQNSEARKALDNFSSFGNYTTVSTVKSNVYDEKTADTIRSNAFVSLYDKKDVFYAKYDQYFANEFMSPSLETPILVDVNENYLCTFSNDLIIKDKCQSDLFKEERIFVIVPESKIDQTDSVIAKIIESYQVDIEKIITVQYTTDRLPTLRSDIIGEGDYMITDPVMVVTNEYLVHFEPQFYTGVGSDNGLKFGGSVTNKEETYQFIVANTEDKRIGNLIGLKNVDRLDASLVQQINSIKSSFFIYTGLLIFSIIFYLILEMGITKLMVEDDRKEIVVKTMNGYSTLQILTPYAKISGLIVALATLLNALILTVILNYSWKEALVGLMLGIAVQGLFTIIFARKIVKDEMSETLKGGHA